MEDFNQTNKTAASITNKNGRYSQNTINNFLSLINKQNKDYSEFSYIADGSFAFVMKAKNNQNKEVAIKVIEYQDTLSGIDAAKREYSLLRNLTNSDYFIKIQDQFDLVGRPNTSEKIIIPNNRFFVQEQKLCSSNLRELLKQFRANKTNPSDSFKEILAIQMLDGLNLLHSRGVIHKDIKPSNFLVSSNENYSVILKLCDIGLASPWRIHELRKNTLQLQDQGYAHYMAPEVIGIKGKCSIQSDLFSLGIVLLELDNALTFDYSQVTSAEYDKLQEGRIFDNITLNRQSFLYNIASIFLNKSCKDRGSAHKMLLSLINKSNEYKRIPIYSIILGNQLESINYDYFFSSKIKKQMKQYPQQTLVDNTDNKMVNGITSELNQPQSKINSQLTTELIKSALRIIFAQGDYDVDLQLLHISLHTIIFGATNIKKNIKCALKLSLCQHKPDVIRKIGIIRICQTPYILRLINFRFFQDTLNNEFILYEFERSNFTLSHYLMQQQIDGEYSQQLKEQIMFQMIDAVNFLHKNDIIHGNITLDSFLVSVNEQGGIEVKSADFDNADMVLSHSEFDEEQLERDRFYVPPYNCISSQKKMISCDDLYNSPEKQLSLGQFSTQKSDCYSLGLCLVVLDNSPSFQEQQLLLDYQDYRFNQRNLDQFSEDNMLINKHSKIYKQATEYLYFQSKQRKPLQICVNDNSTQFTFYSVISEQGFQLPLKQEISLDLQKINDFGNSNTLDQLTTMTSLLSLSLDLDNNHTSEIEAKQILFPISNLINLTNLHLNLQNNGINDTVVKDLLVPLQNLTNISNLSVNLKSNQIGSIGAQYLLLPIANLSNLSFLQLNLQDNQITDIGASFLLSPLKNLQLLSTLNLNLWNNEIKANENIKQLLAPLSNLKNLQVLSLNLYDNSLSDIGSQYLLAPIISLSNLKTLTLDLWSNQIGQSGAESLLSSILNLKKLQTLSLDLWSNSIGDNGAKCLLSPLVNSLNLSTLSINLISNQITETGAIYLLSPLQNLLNLQTIFLDLNCNQIGDIGAKSLLSSFTNLINLQNLKLNLQNNQIGDIGGKYLFSYLSNLINLQHFSVNFYKNNIGDIGATFLLASFEHLVNIQSISIILGRNVIAVEGAKSLLKPLQNLKQFQYLSLNLMHNLIQTEGANSLLCPLSNILSLLNVKLELKSPELKGFDRSKLKEQLKHVQSVTINL